MHIVCDFEVTQDHSGPPNRALAPYLGASRNADATCHGRILANLNVMAYLHLVVDLHTARNHRVLQCSAVNAGIGADFHIVTDPYTTQLLDLDPAPLVVGKAKAIATDDRTGLHQYTPAKHTASAHRHTGGQYRIFANHGTAGYMAQRPDGRRWVYPGSLFHHGRRMHAGRRGSELMMPAPQLGQPGKEQVGVIHHQIGTSALTRLCLHARANCHTARTRCLHLQVQLGVAQKADVLRTRIFQRRDGINLQMPVTVFQAPAQGINNLSQLQAHTAPCLFGSRSAVQGLENLFGDVVLGIDVDRLLQHHIIFLLLSNLLDDLVGTLQHGSQLFALAGAQVFLEFAALALEFTVLIHQLALARHALALGHGGRFALELFAGSLEGVALVEQFFFALGEFGFQLGLGCLGSIGFTEDAIRVYKTSLELLGLCCSTKRQGSSQHHQRKGTRKGFH